MARLALDGKGVKCSITTVVSALPVPGALVAVDAVAVATAQTSPDPANVRLLNAGRAVYISGMAAEGEMAEATRLTLEQLDGALKHLGLTRGDVVHVKSFLRGADDVSAARGALAKFFDGGAPPAAWVEWTMKSPIEIELVAQANPVGVDNASAPPTVTYLNPPPSKVSPLYSRVAVVQGGRMIFTSGIGAMPAGGAPPADAADETRRALAALRAVVTKAGGDFEHLVKATYYPATDATSAALNKVRPEFFNPERPPAASKAPARHTGARRRDLTLDFIAVTPK
jgi:enamine deaminase RidA (YjgF/YER057c/UK114 family)